MRVVTWSSLSCSGPLLSSCDPLALCQYCTPGTAWTDFSREIAGGGEHVIAVGRRASGREMRQRCTGRRTAIFRYSGRGIPVGYRGRCISVEESGRWTAVGR
eukprot:3540213-Rhodomonas_salina.1